MKTISYILASLIIICAVALIVRQVLNEKLIMTSVVVMRDITDPHLSQPKLADVKALFTIDDYQWNGGQFRFVDITDVSYNHVYETKINPESSWMGNEFERKTKVIKFYEDISSIISSVEEEPDNKGNSSIYLPISNELNRLSQSSDQERILMVYSNLMENTDAFSLYRLQNLNLLKINPDSVRKYFEDLNPLKSLKGIKVYLIYQPSDKETDKQYRLIANFYKDFLESKGATVEITANIS